MEGHESERHHPEEHASRSSHSPRVGVLLVNLGTPDSPSVPDVRRYLREFLSDPRVIDIHPVARWLLLNLIILPRRPAASARAYREIFGPEGSPLLVHGRAMKAALSAELGQENFVVELGMRYGRPSIASALGALVAEDVAPIVVLPLFPQYSSAATGSALEAVFSAASKAWNVPTLHVLPEFYDDEGFIRAFAEVAEPVLSELCADHVLMSFHGVPVRHIEKGDPTGRHCLKAEGCCEVITATNRRCYRAQCYATARALAGALSLGPDAWSVSFQSRLGRTPWIRPYTDEVLPALAARGVRRLAIMSPAFVADCLETLEEIGLRARETWRGLGGEAFALVPSLNAARPWVRAVAEMIRHSSPMCR